MPVLFPDDVRKFVESARWTFAKTYAATWPHEYVVRNNENAPMILAIARHIFEHGVEGRFYAQVRKYHHEAGKVYWSMDSTPEDTTLINRCDEEHVRGAARGGDTAGDQASVSALGPVGCAGRAQHARRPCIAPAPQGRKS